MIRPTGRCCFPRWFGTDSQCTHSEVPHMCLCKISHNSDWMRFSNDFEMTSDNYDISEIMWKIYSISAHEYTVFLVCLPNRRILVIFPQAEDSVCAVQGRWKMDFYLSYCSSFACSLSIRNQVRRNSMSQDVDLPVFDDVRSISCSERWKVQEVTDLIQGDETILIIVVMFPAPEFVRTGHFS